MLKLNRKFIFEIILFVVVIGILAFLVFNQSGILKYINIKKEINNLDVQIRNAEEKIRLLELEIDSLNTSKDKINRVAREKFHMMKSNERVLKIEEN